MNEPNDILAAAKRFHDAGRFDQAEPLYRQVLETHPDDAQSLHLLGVLHHQTGGSDAGVDLMRRSIVLDPSVAEFYSNIGLILLELGRTFEAVPFLRICLKLNPNQPPIRHSVAHAMMKLAESTQNKHEAINFYREAISLEPQRFEFHMNLGILLRENGALDQAVEAEARAIQLRPDQAEPYNVLAAALMEQARLDEAIAASRKAIQISPGVSRYYINLLYSLFHHPDSNPQSLRLEIEQWAKHAPQPQQIRVKDCSPNRRLRIGYLSPYFRHCADAHFLLPLLENHDSSQFEVFVFSRSPASDEITARFKKAAHHWHDITAITDTAAVELISQNRIDILMVTAAPADACLIIAAHAPAPVQIAWLAFGSATAALPAVQYRISDPYLDPDDSGYTEQTIRLPQTAWCYDPMALELPRIDRTGLTFGSLNRFSKINADVLETWARILTAVPQSRLIILARPGSHREQALKCLVDSGVSDSRVEFFAPSQPLDYMKQYQRIDIALDTFPYSGHTTALDALWMGVPVVTLRGRTSVGRAAASALANLDLTDLIADSEDRYISIAVSLAHDLPRLKHLHTALRGRMKSSPLMNGILFARNIERIYGDLQRT